MVPQKQIFKTKDNFEKSYHPSLLLKNKGTILKRNLDLKIFNTCKKGVNSQNFIERTSDDTIQKNIKDFRSENHGIHNINI